MDLTTYQTDGFFDEVFDDDGKPRSLATALTDRLECLHDGEIQRRQRDAEYAMFQSGTTFSVYGNQEATERIIPFDVIPRIIEAETWKHVEAGLKQRIQALNLFLGDVYGNADIIKEGIIPAEFVLLDNPTFMKCVGLSPPRGIWCHISGIDLVRDGEGGFYVLEDNLRCPSGVSYVLENRRILKQTFPQLFETHSIRPIEDYAERLLACSSILRPIP